MSKNSLSRELIKAFRHRKSERGRRSWLYCPLCHHDMNGDNESFIKDDGKFWWYKCDNCGCESKWYFHMLPYPIAYQQLTKRLLQPPNPEKG